MKSIPAMTASAMLLAAVLASGAQKQDDAERQLKAAMNTELVDGNINSAIEQYKAIIAKFPKDRAIDADALIHMADCYQKLGNVESRKVYERVIREYSDQKGPVAVARAHVTNVESSSASKGDRAVWSGGFVDGFGTVSPDGHFLTYTDWTKNTNLVLRSLTGGTDRPLTNGVLASAGQGAQYSVISKDGKRVAYEWFFPDKPDELRIASLTGTGIPEYRSIRLTGDIQNVFPMDWSSDGNWIAARLVRKDRTIQMALISAQDGALRILKSTGWSDRKSKIFFSPDGKYLAYAAANPDNASHSGIFIMAADGSREIAADLYPSFNEAVGWSPDGKYVLFISDRSGSTGLWAIPVADGKPQGQTMLVKSDIGPTLWSLGITASGSLYTWKGTGSTYVQVSAIDMNAGKLQGSSTGMFQRFIASRGRPQWSHDGKQLAFESCGTGGGGPCSMLIWSMTTKQIREVPHRLDYFQTMSWSPDGRTLVVGGNDLTGRKGIYKVDVETGATSLVTAAGVGFVQWAPDGKSIYYKADKRSDVILKRDVATGTESELVHVPAGPPAFALSPDGRSIAAIATEGSAMNVVVIPLDGGQPRTVFHVAPPERLRANAPLNWTPDARAVVVMKAFDGSEKKQLWEIPVDGTQPRQLEIDATNWEDDAAFHLSPDGTRMAFAGTAGKAGTEIWAFENLIPTAKSAK